MEDINIDIIRLLLENIMQHNAIVL